MVLFRVDLEAVVRSKCYFWYMKKQRVVVGGDVGVDNSGAPVGNMDILLKSAVASKQRVWVLFAFSLLLQFLFLNSSL